MVNMMSNKEDWCFQFQELQHIAQHCPHIRCHECGEYKHIIMDCPRRIPPSGTPVPHHKAHRNCHTRLSSMHHWTNWERRDWSRSQTSTANIITPAIVTCTKATPDHNNRTGTATIEAAQDDPIQHTEDTVRGPAMTHHTGHTANPPHTTAHQATALRITVDHTYDHLTDHQSIVHTKKDHTVQDHTPARETIR